jgi:hypothetical protein
LKQETTESGDDCHYNILNLNKNEAWRLFKEKFNFGSAFICENGEPRLLTESDLKI